MSRLETSLPIVTATGAPSSPITTPSSGSGTVQRESLRTRIDPPGPVVRRMRGVLQEELGPVGVVDEGVDVARIGLRLVEPRVAAALVRHAGAPDLGRLDRRQQLERRERRRRDDAALAAQRGQRVVVVEQLDGVAVEPAGARPCRR